MPGARASQTSEVGTVFSTSATPLYSLHLSYPLCSGLVSDICMVLEHLTRQLRTSNGLATAACVRVGP